MTNVELALLLYLETCAVDQRGLIHSHKINDEDRLILKEWDETGFVKSGRVTSRSIEFLTDRNYIHWCELSAHAWVEAHRERRKRADRMCSKRTWQKTEEC